MEIPEDNLPAADSSNTSQVEDLSELVNSSYILFEKETDKIDNSLFSFNKMKIKTRCYQIITLINHLVYH
jgi:hypothetical protein